MPTQEQLLKDLKVKQARLKEIGSGLRVGRVLGDRVLVRTVLPRTELDEVEKRGLIYVPETVKDTYHPVPTTGIVIAIGESVPVIKAKGFDEVHLVEVGDMVLFSKVAGMDFSINEQDLRIIQTKEILAVLVDTDGSVVEVKQ